MTRKRFIKLLMSHGESKRKAQKIAYMYNVSGKSYKDAYFNYCGQGFFTVSASCEKLKTALVNLGVSVQSLAKNLKLLTIQNTEVDNG